MNRIWEAFIARLTYWLTPKPLPSPMPESPLPVPPEVLKPGKCECEHLRCTHFNGNGPCSMKWPKSAKWPNGSMCACQKYIPKNNDNGDNWEMPTPSPEELEKLYGS